MVRMQYIRSASILIAAACLGAILPAGCNDEDDPAAPGGTEPTAGVATVAPNPDAIAAPWVLNGPNSYSHNGAGDASVGDLEPGEYTLGWQDVDGWQAPTYGDSLYVAPGTFTRGSPAEEASHYPDEDEVEHEVTLTRGF